MLKPRLSPEQGARIAQALDAATSAIREKQRNAAKDVPAETPIAARRADALERIAEHYLSGEVTSEPAGERVVVKGGDRCTLHLHTYINTLQADGDGAESELASGGCVFQAALLDTTSTHTTSGTGPTAAKPVSITCCYCAVTITD